MRVKRSVLVFVFCFALMAGVVHDRNQYLKASSYPFMAWFLFVGSCVWFLVLCVCSRCGFGFAFCFVFCSWGLGMLIGLCTGPQSPSFEARLLWRTCMGIYQFSFRQVQTCWTTWRKPRRRWTEKKDAGEEIRTFVWSSVGQLPPL